MDRKKIDFINKEGIKYIFFGIMTTVINIAIYMVLTNVGIDYIVSNLIAFIGSVIFAFITNKIYVFNSADCSLRTLIKEIISFGLLRVSTLFLDMFGLIILVEYIHMNSFIAKCIVNILVIAINYVLSKCIVFKSKK